MLSLTPRLVVVCCGLLLCSTSLVAQVIEPAGPIVVVDANGTPVGPAVLHRDDRDGFEVSVVLQRATQIFYLGVRFDTWLDSEDMIGFTSLDCTGLPFLVASSGPPSLFTMAGLGAPGTTLYLGGNGSVRQFVHIHSVLRRWGCEMLTMLGVDAMPAEPVVDLETLFVPPFRLAPAPAAPAPPSPPPPLEVPRRGKKGRDNRG